MSKGDGMTLPPRQTRVRPSTTLLRRARRTRPVLAALLSASALAALGLAPGWSGGDSLVDVVVTGPDAAAVARAVAVAGGTVRAELPLIDGVAADLPARAVLPAGFEVTANRSVSFTAEGTSPSVYTSTVRATIGLPASGDEGHGVTVAVVDTGVADVPDLAGRIVGHVDVTGTGGGDGYGHGTFMAGLIAGSGAASGGAFRGVAPGADILDVKVARQDGSTDLGSVLEGLQVVADQGRAHDIRVLNLSLASGSPVPYQVDPLNQALRALWRRGVTVVVSSGNDGPEPGSVSAPGNDPTLLTVGGIDEHGTAVRDDDTVADWSGRGPTSQGVSKPDLVAPGASVVGLRSPGSVIDVAHPSARIGEGYFRGSGTSMAAAISSGAAADLLAAHGDLRPDDVKTLLRGAAYRTPGLADATSAGRGGLDIEAALALADGYTSHATPATLTAAPGDPAKWQALAAAIDNDDAAGAARAWAAMGPEARSWAARSWAALDPAARSWAARSWAAHSWAARSWAGDDWAARSWAAHSWAGDDWAAHSWAARSWAARSWAARSWAGDDWAAHSWAAHSWAGEDWAAHSWAALAWSARSWSAVWE